MNTVGLIRAAWATAALRSVSMAFRSMSSLFAVESAAAWIYASKPSAAARYGLTVLRSPRIGVAPRDASASAACGVRTSAVTWWLARSTASSTAEPMYPVAPVKKMRMATHHSSSMQRDTLLDFFRDFSSGSGAFLVYDDGFRARTYTYRETADAARTFAAQLQAAGIGKGEKVLFWSENRPEWIIALWGCLLNGTIAVPIDYRASPDFLSRVAHIVDARLLLAGDDVGLNSDGMRDSGFGIRHIWRLSDIDWKKPGTPAVVTV